MLPSVQVSLIGRACHAARPLPPGPLCATAWSSLSCLPPTPPPPPSPFPPVGAMHGMQGGRWGCGCSAGSLVSSWACDIARSGQHLCLKGRLMLMPAGTRSGRGVAVQGASPGHHRFLVPDGLRVLSVRGAGRSQTAAGAPPSVQLVRAWNLVKWAWHLHKHPTPFAQPIVNKHRAVLCKDMAEHLCVYGLPCADTSQLCILRAIYQVALMSKTFCDHCMHAQS